MRYLALGVALTLISACQPSTSDTTAPSDTAVATDATDTHITRPPPPPGCGDSVCNAAIEDTTNCPSDCGSWCGDGVCNGPETTALCPQDCSSSTPQDGCGDGVCKGSESTADCPQDCGDPGTPQPHCGDGTCNGNETSATCPGDCGAGCLPNECGGDCGSCPTGEACLNGQCVCDPQCAGKQCGSDGCGGICGSCNTDENCNNSGNCEAIDTECVATKCGGDCGPCPTGETCLNGQCVCDPQCAGKQCGSDGCGGICGSCNTGENCNNSGNCEAIDTECVATKCGDCGHWDCWLWYSPSNAATAGGTLPDFMDLFDNEQQWANIRAKTGVLFLRAVTLKKMKTTGFIENTLVPKLNEWGIQLALDVSGATWAKCWDNPMTKLNGEIALLNQIQAAGGSVQYLGMQSVLSKPLPATLPEAMQANCPPYTMEDRYQDVAMYVNGMKNAFPDTQVGIVDAMLAHGDDAQAAYTALADVLAGQGLGLDFVLFDHPYHYGEKNGVTSWASLQSLAAFVRNDLGIPTGLYHVSSTGGKASEKQFYDEVLLTQDHFTAAGGAPDYHILSSWYPFPTNELPENAAAPKYPMTKVLAALASRIEGDNTLPKGHIGTVNAKNVLTGWALDTDNPLLSIAVAVYIDGPQGTGTHLGDFLANTPRPDVNAVTGLPGDHGFEIPIPSALQDGQTHTVHVVALDSRGMALPQLLPESPYAFVVGP